MKRLLLVAALLTGLATSAAALAAGTGSIKESVLGAAGVSRAYTIKVDKPADVVVAKAVVPPGASFGWHYHRAFVAVAVRSGTLTLYDSADATCSPERFSAGEGFTERPHHVHLARNEGSTPVVALVTYLGLRHGANPDVPVKRPGNCPF
jgi:quercetin dioxygenase-like cupin family protein